MAQSALLVGSAKMNSWIQIKDSGIQHLNMRGSRIQDSYINSGRNEKCATAGCLRPVDDSMSFDGTGSKKRRQAAAP
jgi:hypothetical protein